METENGKKVTQCLEMEGIIDDLDMIRLFQMKVQLSALGLEIKGLKSRGGSVATTIRNKYGLKGQAKESIFEQFKVLIEQREVELNYSEPE